MNDWSLADYIYIIELSFMHCRLGIASLDGGLLLLPFLLFVTIVCWTTLHWSTEFLVEDSHQSILRLPCWELLHIVVSTSQLEQPVIGIQQLEQ